MTDNATTNNEHEGRGDNPGVGGMPAEEPNDASRSEDPRHSEDERLGDNPGVGGMPARELSDVDDESDEQDENDSRGPT